MLRIPPMVTLERVQCVEGGFAKWFAKQRKNNMISATRLRCLKFRTGHAAELGLAKSLGCGAEGCGTYTMVCPTPACILESMTIDFGTGRITFFCPARSAMSHAQFYSMLLRRFPCAISRQYLFMLQVPRNCPALDALYFSPLWPKIELPNADTHVQYQWSHCRMPRVFGCHGISPRAIDRFEEKNYMGWRNSIWLLHCVVQIMQRLRAKCETNKCAWPTLQIIRLLRFAVASIDATSAFSNLIPIIMNDTASASAIVQLAGALAAKHALVECILAFVTDDGGAVNSGKLNIVFAKRRKIRQGGHMMLNTFPMVSGCRLRFETFRALLHKCE